MKLYHAQAALSFLAVAPVSGQFGTFNLIPFVESINTITQEYPEQDCAVKEGALGNELCPYNAAYPDRTLLRFSTGVYNQGPDDLQVSRTDFPDLFEYGDCHRHWHFKEFTLYELINEVTGEVVTGRKQAFCLMDIRKIDSGAGSSNYGCSNQGITVGWADIYSYNLDGQWIDITGVPAGSYTLRVSINPVGVMNETNYADNTVVITSNQDADLVLSGTVCAGGPQPTDSPTVTARPTDSPTSKPTGAPTQFSCTNFVNKQQCQGHSACRWLNPQGGQCNSAEGVSGPTTPTATPPPTTPPTAPAPCPDAALGEGCESNGDCCSTVCQHNQSAESKWDVFQGRFLRAMNERKLQTSTGTCVCLLKNAGCTANFQCCSGNCNFARAKCSGTDLTDPYGNPL